MKIPKISAKLREKILERDQGCVLADETCNFGLHIHHLRYSRLEREWGKENEEYNLITLCGWHHNLGGNKCVHQNKAMNDQLINKIK